MEARELPKVIFDGKTYYVDSRLHQLRNVENPHDFIGISSALLQELLELKIKER